MKDSNRLYLILMCLALLILVACGGGQAAPAGITAPTAPSTYTTTQPSATAGQPQLEVYFLDVGQADCEIIRYQSNTMVIDSGTNATASSLVSTIKGMNISRFDIAIGTHPHEDHIGGLDAVINNFPIGTLYMPKVSTTTKTYRDVLQAIKNHSYSITTPVPGATFNIGKAECTILAPNSGTYEDLNNFSIVVKVTLGDTSFLFTGDAQEHSEAEMLSKGYNLKADVLKVGHHGSVSSTSPKFLKAVSPQYAIIEVGKNNDYGHPHQVTLDKLAAGGVKSYRTDLNGSTTVMSNGKDLIFNTAR